MLKDFNDLAVRVSMRVSMMVMCACACVVRWIEVIISNEVDAALELA